MRRIWWAAIVAVSALAASLAAGPTAHAAGPSGPFAPGTHVDGDGHRYVVEADPHLPPPPSAKRTSRSFAALSLDEGPDALALHSLPGAARTIYLDVDGATIAGTAWNDGDATPLSFDAAPFDMDGDPGTFSAEERAAIRSIWQRVSEDFAPFAVDVTTQPPAPGALDRTDAADQAYGTTALITDTSEIRDSCGCVGLAYVDVFDAIGESHDTHQPAFVFSSPLQHDPKRIADAVSHEVGHNLGLLHDASSSAGYYNGHGAWAPIMGNGFLHPIVQWSAGEYADAVNPPATTLQDDVAVMAGNGIPLRPDDIGGTAATATVLAGSGPWETGGLISTRTDQDWFRLDLPSTGTVSVHAAPAPVAPDLDIRLSIRNAAGELVYDDPLSAQLDADHASGLDATITRNLTAGTWYLVVDGVGALDPRSTGYSDYGSLGAYTLSAGFTPRASADRVPGDLNGDGTADEGVWRSSNGTWYVNGAAPYAQGLLLPGDTPIVGQWDPDPADDLAVYNSFASLWQIAGQRAVLFGLVNDVPVPADWDGDGDLDIAIYRPWTGWWQVKGGASVAFGQQGDIPVPGQWDADPQADMALYRPSTGQWLIAGGPTFTLGGPNDLPVPVDLDGDGRLEPAVWRPAEGRWTVLGGPDVVLGQPGDVPVPGQWDAVPGDDLGLYRPSTHVWTTPAGSVVLGASGDVPIRLAPWLRGRFSL